MGFCQCQPQSSEIVLGFVADSSEATGLKWQAPAGGGGKVLQVVQGTTSTQKTITTTGFNDTNLTQAITPTSATSKILVMITQQFGFERAQNEQGCGMKIMRDATDIFDTATTNSTGYLYAANSTTGVAFGSYIALTYLDSPATTSSITYKTQGRIYSAANSPALYFQTTSAPSTITLLEIGA